MMFIPLENGVPAAGSGAVTMDNIRLLFEDISFPSSPSSASMAEYGFGIFTFVDAPAVDKNHVAVESGFSQNADGVWHRTWDIQSLDIGVIRDRKKNELAAIRFQHETAGITVNGGAIDTGLVSQAKINGAWAGAQVNPSVMIDWKRADGDWIQIDAATITGIAMSVFAYVQACYTREMQLSQLIDAAEDVAEVDAVDLTVGWP